jgi:hypothetical protein
MAQLSRAVVLIAAVGLVAAAAFAQPGNGPREDRVLSGADVGFRIEGTDPRTGQPTGTWVVRMNGRWVAARAASGIRPAK